MPSYLSFARFYDGLMQDACYEKVDVTMVKKATTTTSTRPGPPIH